MYVPAAFRPSDAELHGFLATGRLCELVTRGAEGLVATTLPMLFEPSDAKPGSFVGHLARANPQWSTLVDDEALVIVHGPDAYVSPRYYPSTDEHGETVPTWNYLSVQGHGRLVVHDPDWTERLVARLSEHFEQGLSRPWSMTEAPRPYLERQLAAIVGVEVVLDRLEGKWKVSQNRPPGDREGVRASLAAGDEAERAIAEVMATREDEPGTD
jgi:transcriptional regulator